MEKIQKLSRRIRVSLQCLLPLLPIFLLIYWLSYETFQSMGFGFRFQDPIPENLTLNTKLLAFLTSLFPMGIFMTGVIVMIKLMKLYERGEVFTRNNTRLIKNIAYLLFAWVIVDFLYNILMSLILSFNNPPGERFISVSINNNEHIVPLIIGFSVLLISYIMDEARKIKEEHDYTV